MSNTFGTGSMQNVFHCWTGACKKDGQHAKCFSQWAVGFLTSFLQLLLQYLKLRRLKRCILILLYLQSLQTLQFIHTVQTHVRQIQKLVQKGESVPLSNSLQPQRTALMMISK
jgi:hypothetical protein